MIKKIVLAAGLMMAAAAAPEATAQAFDVDPQPATTVSGRAADAPGKGEMLSRIKRWVAIVFDDSKVIDMVDPDAGTIVLRWSAPLQQPSQWLAPRMSETCVIDVADDGRWSMEVYSPRIAWAMTEAAGMYDDLGVPNAEAEADSRLISSVSKTVYDGSTEWPIDERLDTVAAAYLEQLQATPQFRNDRDRERGRATDEYRAAERQWRILNEARRSAASYSATLTQSLARALAHRRQ